MELKQGKEQSAGECRRGSKERIRGISILTERKRDGATENCSYPREISGRGLEEGFVERVIPLATENRRCKGC